MTTRTITVPDFLYYGFILGHYPGRSYEGDLDSQDGALYLVLCTLMSYEGSP
jgi:hypothetical protein